MAGGLSTVYFVGFEYKLRKKVQFNTHLDGTTVGIFPALIELLEEGLIEIIDGVVESEKDQLRDLLRLVAAGNLFAATVAVG